MREVTVRRSYKLKLYGNKAKTDTALYTLNRFRLYYDHFIGRCFFGQEVSTSGMGKVANQALHKANNACASLRRLKKTGVKINVPYRARVGCYAKLKRSKTTFDYWVVVPNLWSKRDNAVLPAKSHQALNEALSDGWAISDLCEINVFNGNLYAIVFLSKKVVLHVKPKKFIGCDVGIRQSVSTSLGYLGHGLSKIIKKQKIRQAERRRQGHKISSKVRSEVKQVLDREAKRVLGRSLALGRGISVEKPKRLANLRSGKLQGWARSYFANRLNILAKENSVYVEEVSPYQTSITCSKCLNVDAENRSGRLFRCCSCGHTDHADTNAAKNIERLATLQIGKESVDERKI